MARAKKAAAIDLESMSDDELTALAISVRKEAQRRGIEAGIEVWASALSDEESTRIARQAAETEAARMRAEEARRVAAEAAKKVRDEAERAKADALAKGQLDRAARLRALAVRARDLFGSDVASFTLKTWEKDGDRRLYIGQGYGANWIEYYATGNARTAPDAIGIGVERILVDLAVHLEITRDEARETIRAFCREVCTDWGALNLDVNPSNAPPRPGCSKTMYLLKKKGDDKFGQDGKKVWYTHDAAKADRFATDALALEAAEKYCGLPSMYLADSVEDLEVIAIEVPTAFPPKGA